MGSRCKGQIQGSQSNYQRYDCRDDTWWIIPSRIHKAQIAGDISVNFATLGSTFFSGMQGQSNLLNGINIGEQVEIEIGAKLHYTGYPFPITVPTLSAYRINLTPNPIVGAYLNSISAEVQFPAPATITYSFEFPVNDGLNNFNRPDIAASTSNSVINRTRNRKNVISGR